MKVYHSSSSRRSTLTMIVSSILIPIVIYSRILEGKSIKLSRPSAPLFQSRGSDYITLYMRLFPHDADQLRGLLIDEKIIPNYEVQMEQTIKQYSNHSSVDRRNKENVNDIFRGLWTDTDIGKVKPMSNTSSHFPVSITFHNLSYDKLYRFRVRVINDFGPSPWSSPSEVMETDSTVPKPPMNIKLEARTSNSVTLSWKQSTEPLALSFNLQYRFQVVDEKTHDIDSDQNALVWKYYPDDIIATTSASTPEVQEITTLVDDDSFITKGYFWLKLKVNYYDPTLRTNVLDSSTISKPIAFNATVESFKNAIIDIRGIKNVRVFRYEPELWGISEKSNRGAFSWRVEFDVIGHSAPLFEVYKEELDGEYKRGHKRCRVRRLLKGQSPVFKDRLIVVVDQLKSDSYYEFRVQGVNSYGQGPWGDILTNVKTKFIAERIPHRKASRKQINSKSAKLIAGNGQQAANSADPDYIPGAAMGGFDGEDGSNGIAVIIQYNHNKAIIPSRINYYYTGSSNQYVVPGGDKNEVKDRVDFIDVKLWAGGGAGGGTPRNFSDHFNDGYSNGGGGGFVQTRLKVRSGEMYTIQVGAGGKYHRLDERDMYPVYSGFLGGGQGGKSVMGRHGGSGGGFSAFTKGDHILAIAGGGGGGGATDYCCAHGGSGGGSQGSNGSSPDTPLYITKDLEAEGMSRDEFTAQDCTTNDCIDPRDMVGLPAFHEHLDRGFAPTAEYDINSKGGGGGNQDSPGVHGTCSYYDVIDNHIAIVALPGQNGLGGKGADGKEAGGGGGAGFMGGGGGGSGVDGSGGGGGSGFIDFSSVFLLPDNGVLDAPLPPEVITVYHDSFKMKWVTNFESVYSNIGKRVRVFQVEMSAGRDGAALEGGMCSDEYQLVDTISVQGVEETVQRTIDNLHPKTAYCIRLVAIGDLGTSERSQPIEISTRAHPFNRLSQIFPLTNLDSLKNRPKYEDIYDFNAISEKQRCQHPSRPSPRSGHSLTMVDQKLYLFGGVTRLCVCTTANKCGMKTIYSNEVWSFDLYSREWYLLSAASFDPSSPNGREKHSATRLENGKIMIIGGRSSALSFREVSTVPLFLGDVWEMDPGQITSHVISALTEPQSILEGSVSYHSKHVSITNDPQYREGALCIKRLSIEILLEHACIEQLSYVALQRSDIISEDYVKRDTLRAVKLFIGSGRSTSHCTTLTSNITFNDFADESILDFDSRIPQEGWYQPAENIRSQFEAVRADGNWTLSIFDSDIDGMKGTLLDWKLYFDVGYCSEGVHWKKLSTNSNSCEESILYDGKVETKNCTNDCGRHKNTKEVFYPRHSHTALAINNDVFVVGGNAHQAMSEIWRFNYDTRTWVHLHDNLKRPKFYGQVASLTPFGIIMFGGIHYGLRETVIIEKTLFYDVLDENESLLDTAFNVSTLGYNPQRRYLTSLSFVGPSHLLFHDTLNVPKLNNDIVVIFGGNLGLTKNKYIEDMWILTLEKLAFSKPNSERRTERCREILHPNMNERVPWDWSCGSLAGVNSSVPCRWEDIVLKAWCLDQFQNFYSPM